MSATADLTDRARQAILAQPKHIQAQYESKLTGDLSPARAFAIIRQLDTSQVDDHERGIVPPERHSGSNGTGHTTDQGASGKQVALARKLIVTKLPADAQPAELAKLDGCSWKTASAIIDKLIGKDDLVVTSDNQASEAQIRFINSLRAERGFAAIPDGTRISRKEASAAISDLKLTSKTEAPAAQAVGQGIYRVDGEIYKVQISRQSGRPYAKRLNVETQSFDYDAGAIRKIKPEHRLTLEEAKAFGRETGVCCNCGAELTDPKSIEAGIGPICGKRI